MNKGKSKSDLDKYMKEQYKNSAFTEEEIKFWVDFGINVILKPGKKIIEIFKEHFDIKEEAK